MEIYCVQHTLLLVIVHTFNHLHLRDRHHWCKHSNRRHHIFNVGEVNIKRISLFTIPLLTSPLFVVMHILLYLKFISLLPPPPSVRDALWFLFCFRLEMCLFLLSFLHIFYFSLLSCLQRILHGYVGDKSNTPVSSLLEQWNIY